MADSSQTLLAASESVMSYTQLMESIPCPNFSSLPLQTQEPDEFGLSELKNELGMDPLFSTEVLQDSDDPMVYPSAAEPNTSSDPPSVLDNNFDVYDNETDRNLQSVASSSSSGNEDGDEIPAMVGAGLANLGNTCFLNAVLQCFTHSVPLVQGLHSTTCDCGNDQFCLICTLREHIDRSLSSTKKYINPWKFIDNLSYFSSSFRRYQQEDAHEFLQCFLDRLESSFNDLKSKDDNLVKQVFGGRVISKLRCCNCNHISDTYEPSVDLSLEIGDVTSLAAALESFTKVEHIEDDEMKFTCDECKQKVSVEKQLLLDHIPPICAFHLKRFKNDGSNVEKIDKHVDFPLEFDLQPYMKENRSSLKYDLYAVVVHAAFTSSCGHYYCYVRFGPDMWYKFDDSKVTSVSEAHVLSEEAYILFYAKQGTPWFSNFMETYKPSSNPVLSPKSVLENAGPPSVKSHITPMKPFVNDLKSEPFIDADPPRIQSDVALMKPGVNVISEKSLLALKEKCSNCEVEVEKNTCVTPVTDSKNLKNIDEYFDGQVSDDEIENSDVVYAAKPKQVKPMEKVKFKRQRKSEVEDSVKREAMKTCKKMPSGRGALFMAAMSSMSENSLAKKSKRMTSSPTKTGSKSVDRFISGKVKSGRKSFR